MMINLNLLSQTPDGVENYLALGLTMMPLIIGFGLGDGSACGF
jgi:hypothetical protein